MYYTTGLSFAWAIRISYLLSPHSHGRVMVLFIGEWDLETKIYVLDVLYYWLIICLSYKNFLSSLTTYQIGFTFHCKSGCRSQWIFIVIILLSFSHLTPFWVKCALDRQKLNALKLFRDCFRLETCRREARGHWCAIHTCVLRSPLFFAQHSPTAFSNLECLQHFARTQWRGQVSPPTSSWRRLWLALGIQETGEWAAGPRRNLLEVFGWYCPFLLVRPAGPPSRRRMRSSCVLLTALVALAAYYIYIPLPSSVSDPWKLMLLDATFRSAQQVVRRSPGLILCPFS